MAEYTCHNCVYAIVDAGVWLRRLWKGEPLTPQCANHPQSPGRLTDVTGIPCRNYRPKPVLPCGDAVRMIPLGDGFYAYVDAADYDWLMQWKWYMASGYPARTEKGKLILMHRQIMHPPKGKIVDHWDGSKANNCRCNLRVCKPIENQLNKRKKVGSASRYKGVFYENSSHKWGARCKYGGRLHTIGRFEFEIDAARAYDFVAVLHLSDFARLNFPEEWPPERRAELRAEAAAGAKTEGEKVRRYEVKKRKPTRPRPTSRPARKSTPTRRRRGESSFARKSQPNPKPSKPKRPRKKDKLPQRSQRTQRPKKK